MTQNKKIVKHSRTSKKRKPNRKGFFLLKLLPTNRRSFIKTALSLLLLVAIAGAIPFPYTFAKTVTVPFDTIDQKSAGLELGDTEVLQEGANGSKVVQVESLHSTWGRLFGLRPTQQKETTSTTSKPSVNKMVANGTIKYQYMLCSDGGFRFYTDEQFKDETVGFTSKSQDDCAANNKGNKVSLTNIAPSNNSATSASRPTSTTQPDTYEADKINREAEKLRWCSQQDEILSNEYIGKVHQAQASQDITDKEFNAIVDPAYWKYSLNIGLLRASGCIIAVDFPNYIRQ